MAVVTRVVLVRGDAVEDVIVEKDWRVTALAVRGPNLAVYVGDTIHESSLLLHEAEYNLNTNILLAEGTHLLFENRNAELRQYGFFTAEEVETSHP